MINTSGRKYFNVNSLNDNINKRFWECLLVIFIIGLLTLSFLPGWSQIMILYGLAISYVFMIYFLTHKLTLQPEIIIYFLWILWAICGLVNVIDQPLFLKQFRTIIQIAALLFVIAGITALKRDISMVFLGIAIGGTLVALSSYYFGDLQSAGDVGARTRTEGIAGNANSFAYHLLFVVFACFYFFEKKSSVKFRAALLVVIAALVIGIIFSGSRKGLLGVFTFIFLWWFFCRPKQLPRNPFIIYMALLVVLVCLCYAYVYVMSNTYIGERFKDVADSGTEKRVSMYKEGINMIKEYPLFGVGLNNYRAHYYIKYAKETYSHSEYIEVAANTGIVGLILYFSIYVILWHRFNRIRSMTNDKEILYIIGLLKASIITILLLAIGRPNIISKLTWIFLAGAIGYSWAIEQVLCAKIVSKRDASE